MYFSSHVHENSREMDTEIFFRRGVGEMWRWNVSVSANVKYCSCGHDQRNFILVHVSMESVSQVNGSLI